MGACMNAYELADELDCRLDHKAANMLRQQADRIAEFEKQRWTEKDLKNACRNARLSEDDFLRIKAYLPVYTTPQTKPLSDEEIYELKEQYLTADEDLGFLFVRGYEEFARAIEERYGIK